MVGGRMQRNFCLPQSHENILLHFLLKALLFFTFIAVTHVELIFTYSVR